MTKGKFRINIHKDRVSIQKRFFWFFYGSKVVKAWSEMDKQERTLCREVIDFWTKNSNRITINRK